MKDKTEKQYIQELEASEANQKRAEKAALRESESLCNTLFENTGGAMLIFDDDTTILRVNIHFYASRVMEIVRISYLRANSKFVVPEHGNDGALEAPSESGVVFSDFDDLVEKCFYYLHTLHERRAFAQKGFAIMQQRSQAAMLRAALTLTAE